MQDNNEPVIVCEEDCECQNNFCTADCECDGCSCALALLEELLDNNQSQEDQIDRD